jgi:hypothetical protein
MHGELMQVGRQLKACACAKHLVACANNKHPWRLVTDYGYEKLSSERSATGLPNSHW